MNDGEVAFNLDEVEEALLGVLARQNNVTVQEQIRRIVRSALDEAARNTVRLHDVRRH